jgi:CelD/BcsL family acetyltransferase involved in cellulose biosynthesis
LVRYTLTMPSIEIMKGAMVFDSLGSDWNRLYSDSPYSTPFQSPAWIKNWVDHFSSPSRLTTIVVREGGDLVGVFPLVRGTALWSPLRSAGVGPSDYLGPLIAHASKSLEGALGGALNDLAQAHLIDLHQMPNDHPFAAVLAKESSLEQARCLILDLPATFAEYVGGLSKSLRYDVRRLEGKALKEKGATVEWVTPETVDGFADQFFELHRLRWKSRGLPGAFFGKNEAFQRKWMQIAVQDGTFVMNRLVSEGKAVGCVYAMMNGRTCFFYQAGMDPEASSLSPGTILVAKMIERAIGQGCQTFDFMRGDEPYKRRWKPNRERVNLRILMGPQNVVGRVGTHWNQSAWRVELKIRQRLEGKSLKPSKAPNQNP